MYFLWNISLGHINAQFAIKKPWNHRTAILVRNHPLGHGHRTNDFQSDALVIKPRDQALTVLLIVLPTTVCLLSSTHGDTHTHTESQSAIRRKARPISAFAKVSGLRSSNPLLISVLPINFSYHMLSILQIYLCLDTDSLHFGFLSNRVGTIAYWIQSRSGRR